ncbi:MAG: hypothetical protein GEV08_20020 [Acidimicrobiia bacterium]|nr:hypothetical protein [Acidimicrobiia bacterium]
MAGKKRGGGSTTPGSTSTASRRRANGGGLVPGFSNDEQLALGLIHAQVLGDARQDLLSAPDALCAESWASATWGLAYGRELVGNDLEAVLGGGLVQFASHQRAPEALALLRSLAAVAPDPYDAEAARAADALAEAGVDEVGWAGSLGVAVAGRAVLVRDPVDDDGVSVFIGYGGGAAMPPHSVGVYVDHNLGGIAKDAYLGPELEQVESASRADGTLCVDAVALGGAAALVRAALEATDQAWDPPISETFRATRALLLARLRALPVDAAVPASRATLGPEERAGLVVEFAASPEARSLDPLHVERLGGLPLQFSCEQVGGDPLRFSPTMVELFCTEWAPRQLVLGPDELVRLPDVLRSWIRFASRRRQLPAARVAAALAAVDQWGEGPAADTAEPFGWGPAHAIVEELERRGIDPADEEALGDFLDELNAEGGLEAIDPAAVLPFPGAPGDEEDLERFADELAEAEAEAAGELRAQLAAHVGAPPPAELAVAAAALRAQLRARDPFSRSIRAAAGFRRLPGRDDRLVVRAAAAYLTLADVPESLDADQLALTLALDHVDWLVLATAALDGARPVLDERWVARSLGAAEPGLDADDTALVCAAFGVVSSPWQAAGVVDQDGRLTRLGRWVLPRALSYAWGHDFDAGRPVAPSSRP